MKKTVLRSYARLIAACGVNIQKGQEVFIQAELDQPEFVTMLVEECYKLKAKEGRRRLEPPAGRQASCALPDAYDDVEARQLRAGAAGSTMWTRFPVGFT